MFASTLDLITEAASSSLVIFCFCNLIIAVIHIGSKPGFSSNCDQQTQVPISKSKVNNAYTDEKQATAANHGNKLLIDVGKTSNAHKATIGGDNHENDEFRKRVQEFIDEVNRGWKAESGRASYFD